MEVLRRMDGVSAGAEKTHVSKQTERHRGRVEFGRPAGLI